MRQEDITDKMYETRSSIKNLFCRFNGNYSLEMERYGKQILNYAHVSGCSLIEATSYLSREFLIVGSKAGGLVPEFMIAAYVELAEKGGLTNAQ